MSIRYGQKALPSANKKVSSFVSYNRDNPIYDGPVAALRSTNSQYIRPSDYAVMPTITDTEEKIALLVYISNDNSNFLSFIAAGNFKVDWGDGSAEESFSTGTTANHTYDYSNVNLNVNPTRSDGFKQAVVIITPQAGQNITNLQLINFTPPISGTYTLPVEEIYISAPNLTNLAIGTATTSTIYCRNCSYVNLINSGTITNFSNLFQNIYRLQRVDIGKTAAVTTAANMFGLCPNLLTVNFSANANFANVTTTAAMFTQCSSIVVVPLFDTANVTDMSGMFNACSSLSQVPLYNTGKVTNMSSMFSSCNNISNIPAFNTTNVTNMSSMFNSCINLANPPAFDTSNVTNMQSMFSNCSTLKTVPLFNTIKAQDMSNMFFSCSNLISVPLFDTRAVTTMATMFQNCLALVKVPLFNTENVITMANMFNGCFNIVDIPPFNTGNVTTMQQMFVNCYRIKTVPLFNTIKVTTIQQMFSNCITLTTIPQFNLAAATIVTQAFASCVSLVSIPAINFVSVTSFLSIFSSCFSLASFSAINVGRAISFLNCKLSKEALETMFTNLIIPSGLPAITITNNWGAPTPITLTGTPSDASVTISMANTTGLSAGMQVTGTNTILTTGRTVTFTDVDDIVTLNNHGLSNGDEVAFSTITTTTGIITRTIYFVRDATTNTFKLAATAGGEVIPLTNNGSGTIRYNSIIVSINPNVSVTMSRPMAGGGAQTLAFRSLQTYRAILKGYGITG